MTTTRVRPAATLGAARPARRRYELDWLRAFVVLSVILYHVVGIFVAGTDLYPQDSNAGLQLDALNLFVNSWAIPLLFVISGAAASFALRRHSVREYLRSLFMRLALPFLFCTLVIIPVQVYFVLLSDPSLLRRNLVPITDPHALDNYLHFYPQYLRGYWYFLGHFSWQLEVVFWGHLWFIAHLIVCALVALPLFLLLRTGRGKRVIEFSASVLQWPPVMTLVPGLLFGAVIVVLRQDWVSRANLDWPQSGVLLLCYLLGYVLYADHRNVRTLKRILPLALPLALIAFACLALVDWFALPRPVGLNLRRMTEGMTDWLWVAVFLSLGARYLARSSRVLPYVNEGSYSFYVLHMPILLGLAALVLQLLAPSVVKIPLLFGGTLLLTFAVYALLIRRFAVTRVLFGVRLAPTSRGSGTPTTSPQHSQPG